MSFFWIFCFCSAPGVELPSVAGWVGAVGVLAWTTGPGCGRQADSANTKAVQLSLLRVFEMSALNVGVMPVYLSHNPRRDSYFARQSRDGESSHRIFVPLCVLSSGWRPDFVADTPIGAL